MSDLLSWLQLMQLPVSRQQKHKLLQQAGSAAGVLSDPTCLNRLQSYCQQRAIELPSMASLSDGAEALLEDCEQLDWQVITPVMSTYPQLLLEIPDPPLVLYLRGRAENLNDPQVAIVGSRKATPLGAKLAQRCAKHLSDWGLGVVSGLAKGIDSYAHQGALEGTTPTVAVLANGPGSVYPRSNQRLADCILEQGGTLLTENPPGTQLEPWLFPQRNRLISGLALGTLVVEASLKSGSLVTAKLAASQGREVFAVPGALTNPQARGCHQLIKQGAVLVESPEDIINALHRELRELCPPKAHPEQSAQSGQSPVLRLLDAADMTLEELVEVSGVAVGELQVELARLELSGTIVRRSGRYFKTS